MNLWRILLGVSAALLFAFFLPPFFTKLLSWIVVLMICALIFANTNAQEDNGLTSNVLAIGARDSIKEIGDEDVCKSNDVIAEISADVPISPATSAISTDKIKEDGPNSNDTNGSGYPINGICDYEDCVNSKGVIDEILTNVPMFLATSAISTDKIKEGGPNSNDTNGSGDPMDGICDAGDYVNSKGVIDETSTDVPMFLATSATPTDKIETNSTEMSYLDAKFQTISVIRDKLLPICSKMEGKTTKDTNLHCRKFAEYSEETGEFIHAPLKAVEEVDQIFSSSANFLDEKPKDNTVCINLSVVLQTDIHDEMLLGQPICSDDIDPCADEIRVTNSEGNLEQKNETVTIEYRMNELFVEDVPYRSPLDTIPLEFIYPCLPYVN